MKIVRFIVITFSLRSTQTLHNMVFISQQFSSFLHVSTDLPLGILRYIYYPTNWVRNSLESSLSLEHGAGASA